MNFTIEEIISYVLIGFNVLFVVWLTRLEIKSKDINIMKNKVSLKTKINSIDEKLEVLYKSDNQITKEINKLENKLNNSLQNPEVIRFNPFKNDGVGGDQSFAATLLNKKGNGMIISSLYTRENVRIFAKPIKNWESKYELSEEENLVLGRTKSLI